MKAIRCSIVGVPFCKDKPIGATDAVLKWKTAVIEQTRTLPVVASACLLHATFRLPKNKFPLDYPFGSDIDNLVKCLFDALNETIFNNDVGKDSCVVVLQAAKVHDDLHPGVDLEILLLGDT